MEEWLDYIRKDWHPRSHENCVTKHYDKDGKEFYPMPTASEWMPETILNNMRGYDHYITNNSWAKLIQLPGVKKERKKPVRGLRALLKMRKMYPTKRDPDQMIRDLDFKVYNEERPEYEHMPRFLHALEI